MPDTLTQFFGITKPALHSTGWGPKANTDYDNLDSVLGLPRGAFVAPTVGPTTTLDLSLGSAFVFTLNQAITLVFANPAANPAGVTTQVWQSFRLRMVGDGTRRAVTFPGSVTFLTGLAPVLTPSGSDYFEFFTKDNGVTWLGLHRGVVDLPPFTVVTYNAAGTTNIDLATGRQFKVTVAGGITTFAFINFTQNAPSFRLIITNGGSQVLTWPGSVVWLVGSPPSLQAAGVDELEFITPDGGVTWYGARVDPLTSIEHCKANRSASLAVAQNTDVVIPFTAADSYDVGSLHDPASNPERITVPAGGWAGSEVEIIGQATWDTNAFQEDLQQLFIKRSDGVELGRTNLQIGNDGVTPHTMQVTAYDDSPAAGIYYSLFIRTSRGGGNNVTSAWMRLARKR